MRRFPNRLWTEHLDTIAVDLARELKRDAQRRQLPEQLRIGIWGDQSELMA